MCYNVKALLWSQMIRARNRERFRDQWKDKIQDPEIFDLHHVSGFKHPKMLIYQAPDSDPVPATWGLVPHWVKDDTQRVQLWNSTLNARGESIFEKPSFRDSAKSKRCLICVDGFFEHHHFNGKAYPYFIYRKDGEPMVLAGLWSTWKNPEDSLEMRTFSIVTTQANTLMARIHNNPDREGPRMPLILTDSSADEWLMPIKNDSDKQFIQSMIQPYNPDAMEAHTVGVLSGKNYIGNSPEVTGRVDYPGLI